MKQLFKLVSIITTCFLCLYCQAQTDPCASIATLTCATPTTVTLAGTGVWNNATCGFSTPGQEKIYSFTPTTTGAHTLQVTSASGTGYIDYMYKQASIGCTSTAWTCIDDINFTGTFSIGTLTAGVQYYILLDAESTNSSTQTFQVICPVPVVAPCANIATLSCATPTTVTLAGTGVWNNATCGFSTPGQEKIYSFTPTTTGAHSIQVTSASNTGYIDYMYKAASGGCTSTGWTCIDDVNFTGTFSIGTLTAGVQYYILLDAESTSSSTQTFQVICPVQVPSCLVSPTSPNIGQSLCATAQTTLSWPTVAGATSYDIYFGATNTPPFVSNTTSTSYVASTSTSGTYYWQVVPKNATGAATGCSIWNFTVKADPVGNLFSNPIVIGSFPYSTTGNNLATNCFTSNYSGPNNQSSSDVFYKFTKIACESRINITTCGSGFDTYIHVLNSSGDPVASDDNGATCAPGLLSALQLDNLAAGIYYIVVEGFGNISGNFSMSVTASYLTWYKDTDNDGYSTENTLVQCNRPTGYKLAGELTSSAIDCNDDVAAINPGATELCDGVDNNCNGQTDEGCNILTTWYRDNDGDGWGRTNNPIVSVTKPNGYTDKVGDCNDGDNTIFTNAPELPDGKDNDCDGLVDEGLGCPAWYRDEDGDLRGRTNNPKISCVQPAGYVNNANDCNDVDATIYLGAPELPDGKDNNCDGQTDENLGCRVTWYRDVDGDGRGRTNLTKLSCVQPVGYADNSNDCNDGDATIYLGAPELCDGKDNDCDGVKDDNCAPLITSTKQILTGKPVAAEDESVLNATIWPNPTRTELMVTLDAFVPNQKLSITIMQADGKVQQSQSLTPSVKGQQVRLDVSSAAGGFYLLQIKQGLESQTKRVVIIK